MQINRNKLLDAIKLVSKSIPTSPAVPILTGMLIEVSENVMTLTGFDINNGIQTNLEIEGGKDGRYLVSAKVLQSVVSKIKSSEIDLIFADESVIVAGGSAQSQIQLMSDADDYPNQCFDITGIDPQPIDSKIVKGILSTTFATSTDPTKMILQAVNIFASNGKVVFAATDGHRLAVTTCESEVDIESISLSNSGLKMLSDYTFEDESLAAYRVEGGLIVADRTTKFLIRELEGKYPDYSLLFPKTFKIELTANRVELIQAVELANVENANKLIKLVVADDLMVSSEQTIVTSSSIVPAESNLEINFALNSDYFLDLLKQVESEEVTLNINDPLSPITTTWKTDLCQKTILLMPVKLRS